MSIDTAHRSRQVFYAQTALTAYMAVCHSDEEDALGDLLTDLLHLAHAKGHNVLDTLQRATLVFCDEASEKEPTQ